MTEIDYIRGLDDALEMALEIVNEAKDLQVAKINLEKLQVPVKEKKIQELRRKLFIFPTLEEEAVNRPRNRLREEGQI